MSNPQEPYQPRPADAGAQQPPAPPRQPPAQPYGSPQGDGRGQYTGPQYATPPGASHPSGGQYAQGGQHPQSGQYPGQDGAPGQYPDPSPFGLPGQPPAKDRKKLWIILGIAGVKSLEMNDTCKPAYNDVKVASENGVNSADIAGVITCDGQQIDLAYRFEGTDELKMTNIKLRPKT